MEIMHLIANASLLLTLILTTIITNVTAAPTFDIIDRLLQYPIDRFDNDYYLPYMRQPMRRSSYDLQSGYYYIDAGSITPVTANGQRRQDNFAGPVTDTNNLPDGVQYTPLVRVKETKTKKHKKLFVPNLFG